MTPECCKSKMLAKGITYFAADTCYILFQCDACKKVKIKEGEIK